MKKLSFLILLICVVSCCRLFTACTFFPAESQNEYNQKPLDATDGVTEIVAESTGVYSEESLATFLVGMESDSLTDGFVTAECDFWSTDYRQPYQEETASKRVTIIFEGVSYTGDYSHSRIDLPNTYRSDYYRLADGEFAVNAETGDVVFWGVPNAQIGEMTAEDCEDIANEFVSQFADLEQYSLTIRPGNYMHNYKYTKYINGVPTADMCSVSITTAGKIVLFDSRMLGAFDSGTFRMNAEVEQDFTILSSSQVETALADKVQTIYNDLSSAGQYEKSTFSYEVKNSQLVLLPDNSIGKLYRVDISVKTPFENEKYFLK